MPLPLCTIRICAGFEAGREKGRKAPGHRHEFAFAVFGFADDGRCPAREDRGRRLGRRRSVVRYPEQSADRFDVSGLAVQVTLARGCSGRLLRSQAPAKTPYAPGR